VLNKLLPLLLLPLLTAATLSARDIEARFTTDKTNYLAGEPVFVALTVSSGSEKSIFIDLKSPDLAKLLCEQPFQNLRPLPQARMPRREEQERTDWEMPMPAKLCQF
jgi:hypothetical protein